MSIKKSVHRLALIGLVLACAVGLAAAADLGGTTWDLGGMVKTKVKKVGRETEELNLATLTFNEDGTCSLDFRLDMPAFEWAPNVSIGCTWESGEGRRFTVDFDDEDLTSALTGVVTALYGMAPDDVRVATEKAKGKVSKDMERIKLKVKVKAEGSVEVDGEPVSRRIRMKLAFTGTAQDVE